MCCSSYSGWLKPTLLWRQVRDQALYKSMNTPRRRTSNYTLLSLFLPRVACKLPTPRRPSPWRQVTLADRLHGDGSSRFCHCFRSGVRLLFLLSSVHLHLLDAFIRIRSRRPTIRCRCHFPVVRRICQAFDRSIFHRFLQSHSTPHSNSSSALAIFLSHSLLLYPPSVSSSI